MYSTYNVRMPVVAERFIRTIKNKIQKHMAAVSKNVYFDFLNDIIYKYNKIYHRAINMKPIKAKPESYANTMLSLMKKILKFKFVIILEFQNRKTLLPKAMLLIGQKTFL